MAFNPRALIATCVLFACGGASPAAPLDDLLHFEDPYKCTVSKNFDALLDGLIRWEEAGSSYKGKLASPPVPAAFQNWIGTPVLTVAGNEYRATLPLRGTWRGLPLHSIVRIEWAESETGFYLVFDVTRNQVLAAANRAGFQIPQSGSEYRDVEAIGVNVGVDTFEGRGALYCIDG